MKYTLQKISPLKAACFSALISAVCSFPVTGIIQIFASIARSGKFPWIALLIMPTLFAGTAFVFALIICVSYNFAAKLFGGIRLEIDEVK